MSRIICFASDLPFKHRPNPHEKIMSVNQAIAGGVCNIPDFMLSEYFDKNKPGVIMIADREVNFNIDITDGDFAIIASDNIYVLRSDKKYFAVLEYHKLTQGRILPIIGYIKEHLKLTDEIEPWHIWLGAEDEYHSLKAKRAPISQLTAEYIFRLENRNLHSEILTDYCLTITK